MKDDLRFACHLLNQALHISQYCYPMYQNGDRPVGPFAAVRRAKVVSQQLDTTELVTLPSGEDVMRTTAHRVKTFDFLFVMEDENIDVFDSCWQRQDIINRCNKYGYGFLTKRPTDLQNTQLETNWELRQGITVDFHHVKITDVPLEVAAPPAHDLDDWTDTTIEEIEATGDITTDQGTTIETNIHIIKEL